MFDKSSAGKRPNKTGFGLIFCIESVIKKDGRHPCGAGIESHI